MLFDIISNKLRKLIFPMGFEVGSNLMLLPYNVQYICWRMDFVNPNEYFSVSRACWRISRMNSVIEMA